MKNLKFSRKNIFRAIYAASVAFALTAGRAQAQFIYNGQDVPDAFRVNSAPGTSNTLGASGTFGGYFLDSGKGKNTVTIASGANITNRISGSIIEFGQNGGAGGTVTNQGTLSDTASGSSTATVDIATGSALLKLTNAGLINSGSASASYGVEATATGTGAITIDNTSLGTITSSGSYDSTSIDVTGNGGAVTIDNKGSIYENGGFSASATGLIASNKSGAISIMNSGALSASGYGYYNGAIGVSASIAGAGDLVLNNSGSVGSSASGFYGTANALTLATDTGDITITNTGSVSASAYQAQGLIVNSGGSFALTNGGSIVGGGGYYEGQEGFGPYSNFGVSATAVKDVSITNSGYIRGTASTYSRSGSAQGIAAFSSEGGVSIDTTSSVSSSNSLYGSSMGIYAANNSSDGITVLNSDSVSANALIGNAFGIYVATGGTKTSGAEATITNSGAISTNSYYPSVGIEVVTSALRAGVTNGTGGTINAGGTGGSVGIQIQDTVGSDVIVNEGSITGTGAGIEDLGTGDITLNNAGGSITAAGGNPAIKLGSGNNKVTVTLGSAISGLIDGGKTHAYNTLTFTGSGASPSQVAALRTVSAEAAANPAGTYSVTLGSETYTFTDFNVVKITH